MDIWTGYFAQMKKYKKANLVPVSIAYGTPIWYEGETCFELAPPRKLLVDYKQNGLPVTEYTKRYNEFLKTVNWSEVIDKLYSISEKYEDKDLILCCFEKPADFCHRHLLAEFLTRNGIDIQEWIVK